MESAVSFLIALTFVRLLCLTDLQASGISEPTEVPLKRISRDKFTTEKLLNFSQYVRVFDKRQLAKDSPELTERTQLHLAREIRAFVSAINYKQRQFSYYLKANKMIDRRPEEIESALRQLSSGRRASPVPVETRNQLKQRVDKKEELKDNEVYIDHSLSNCFSRARDQGQCGACYIFATIALYEWVHCHQTGILLSFSEQYVIDCGWRAGLKGCDGGTEYEVSEFVELFGLELKENYPYRGHQDECPYDNSTSSASMGSLRLKEACLRRVPFERIELALKRGPIIMGIAISGDFSEYAGGVHDGIGCKNGSESGEAHSLLLVGHGLEDGKEYWLFRNSYSARFGLVGYYKLNKASDCLLDDGAGLTSKALFGFGKLLDGANPNYDGVAVAKRMKEYLS